MGQTKEPKHYTPAVRALRLFVVEKFTHGRQPCVCVVQQAQIRMVAARTRPRGDGITHSFVAAGMASEVNCSPPLVGSRPGKHVPIIASANQVLRTGKVPKN